MVVGKRYRLGSPRREHFGFSTIWRFSEVATFWLDVKICYSIHTLFNVCSCLLQRLRKFIWTLLSRSGVGWSGHVHFRRRSTATNFCLRTTSGDICNLTILIHCFRCARMNEVKKKTKERRSSWANRERERERERSAELFWCTPGERENDSFALPGRKPYKELGKVLF